VLFGVVLGGRGKKIFSSNICYWRVIPPLLPRERRLWLCLWSLCALISNWFSVCNKHKFQVLVGEDCINLHEMLKSKIIITGPYFLQLL